MITKNKLKSYFYLILVNLILIPLSSMASTYYMAVTGSDSNPGTLSNPWKSFEKSISKLNAGDTLLLRNGIYYEESMDINLKGNQSDPIIIKNYPGENVEISGGISDFRSENTNKWQLIDADINLYKSSASFEQQNYMNAWLLEDDLHLITFGETNDYDSWENLTSTNYGPIHNFEPIFVGPGIMQLSDGHLYMRLENNPNDLIDYNNNQFEPTPAEINPNNHKISVFFTEKLITFANSEYLVFKNIIFSHAKTLFDVENNTDHIEFDGCRFDYGRYGFVFRNNSANNYKIQNCEFNNGLPDNVYWCDVKNRDSEVHEAYPEFQSAAIHGEIPGFSIRNNLFRDSFDAIFISGISKDVKIEGNDFIRLRDDAISLGLVKNVEISENIMWTVGAGVSSAFKNEFNSNNGDVYIHHNIIDFSFYQHGGRKGNYRENHWPVWQIIHAFASHEDSYSAPWKVYNNTIIGRKSGYEWNPVGLPDALYGNDGLFVLNNIFFVKDDRIIFRDHQVSSGAHYDGNVVFRLNPADPEKFTIFYNFGDGENYISLNQFLSNSETGWEQNGLETDPLFDLTAIENPLYQHDNIRERYKVANPAIFTTGASYSGLNWPGTQDNTYRGALKNQMTTAGPNRKLEYPIAFSLTQNYPNPFNPTTTIRYDVKTFHGTSQHVNLSIYNLLGKKVATLVDKQQSAGSYQVQWDGSGFTSGVYYIKMDAAKFSSVKKAVLMK